jgi:hypothetical protein
MRGSGASVLVTYRQNPVPVEIPLYRGRHLLNLQVTIDTRVSQVPNALWAPIALDTSVGDGLLSNASLCSAAMQHDNVTAAWAGIALVPPPSYPSVTYAAGGGGVLIAARALIPVSQHLKAGSADPVDWRDRWRDFARAGGAWRGGDYVAVSVCALLQGRSCT